MDVWILAGQSNMQGCAPLIARSYCKRFTTWISAVRTDLNIPDLPIIVVQIARRAMGTLNTPELAANWDIVRDALLGLGELRIHCSGVTGNWQPARHMAGFGIYRTDGSSHPDCWVINASRDPHDGTAIRLLLNKPADASGRVGYGRGADPYCNAVDEADLPLAAGCVRFCK